MNKDTKRKIKYALAKSLFWVPDDVMLRIQYFILKKRKLHLKNPQRFSEKVQWYKAYYHNPEMLDCVDKYRVREYVAKKLGTDKYLNELYQVCDDASQINFNALPDKFVIKTSDGGGGDNVLICKNKKYLDIDFVIHTVNSWRNKQYYIVSREWAYRGAKDSKILVEKYLVDKDNLDESIDDYKFFCYNGNYKFLWVDKDRFTNHTRCFYDQDLRWIKGIVSDYPASNVEFPLPANIGEMITVAEKLSMGFPFVRVDLYNLSGTILFGEMTFYPASGYLDFYPDSFDYELGKFFEVQSLQK